MKITGIKTYLVNAKRQNWLFVKVMTDEGFYGWGEASVEGQEKATEAAIHTLAQRSVIDEDPRNADLIYQKMYRHGFWKSGFIYGSAISGIDQAIWDIKGKVLGVPVYELLGGRVRDKIRCYTHGDETNAAELIEKGFGGIKTGVGAFEVCDNPAKAAKQFEKRLAAIRKIIGEDNALAVDHHGQSNVRDSLKLIEAAKDYDLHFFEEPISPENAQLYQALHSNPWNVPIAAGERLYSRFDFREIITNQWLDLIQPDICHCGGISEIRKIAYMAEPYLIKFAPHNPNGPVATAASLQVAAAMQNFDILEFAQTVYLREELYNIDLKPVNGYFKIPTKPGLGIELDEASLEKFPYKNIQYSARYRADGTAAEI